MTAVAILVAILISTPAVAQSVPTPHGTVLPPIEYDYPFEGSRLIIQRGNKDVMEAQCPKQATLTMACAQRQAGTPEGQPSDYCRIFIADDALLHERIKTRGFWDYDIILRHEIGHCNGWSSSHFGARHAEAEQGRSPTWKSLQGVPPLGLEARPLKFETAESERILRRDRWRPRSHRNLNQAAER
jgi:hypothetical protein